MEEDPNIHNVNRVEKVEKTDVVQTPSYEQRETVVNDVGTAETSATNRVVQFFWWVLAVIEIILGLRFLLRLIGANPSALFAHWVYEISGFFIWPFQGLVSPISNGNMVIDITTLIAMLVYLLVFWAITKLIWVLFYPRRVTSVSSYHRRIDE